MSQSTFSFPEDRRVVRAGELAREVLSSTGVHHVVGAEGVGPVLVARALALEGAPVVYVTTDSDMARRAAADLAFVARAGPLGPGVPGNPSPLSLMVSESSAYADVRTDRRTQMQRAGVLHHVAAGLDWRFLVVPAPALLRLTTPRAPLVENALELVAESEIDVSDVSTRLAHAGYLRAPVVEDPGSFAVRGGVLDVWPGNTEAPVRAELYGDLIVSLKLFDPENQRTREGVERVLLPPAREIITSPKNQERARERIRDLCDVVNHPSTKARALEEDVVTARSAFGIDGFLPAFYELVPLWSLLPENTVFVIEDPPSMIQALRAELERAMAGEAEHENLPHFPRNSLYSDESALAAALSSHSTLAAHRSAVAASVTTELESIELAPLDAPSLAIRDSADLARAVKAARAERGKGAALDPLIERIATFHEAGLSVNITARTSTQSERLATLLGHRGVPVVTGAQPVPRDTVRILTGELVRGGVIPSEGLVLLTEEEIFGQRAHRRPERARSARAILEDLRALEPGDHVVHVDHGVGRYLGLEKRSINGVGVELLVVEYGGGDKLFLPVYRLNQVQKYSGGDGAPKLDRLGGLSFAKTKARVQRRVRQMADELLRLYAERQDMKREPLETADDDYAAFEATFPYEETRDQAAAISEVMRDLEKKSVMDRLVCGDVGFGKTEVALRAAFRIATAGRQVAILCPTTVLAQQHLLTFSSRLAGYPLVVKALSRFETKSEQTETLKGLKEGKVDVVIGTHRLLSKDVHFARLGLLVVDEEQRFGVTHKERIKQIRASVDVLTLSATPIPRTLQLAVGGLRDMSLITTPPMDRRSIRTIVSRWDEHIIREAIERELSRGGQIFYVYNRVEGLYERAARLQQLVPQARVAVGHGQMSEASLEKTMLDFVDGKYDVLGSTAIIESGLDIPRANTIIIDRADLFGLAQLYQLRGRVGRSSERAYCYLIVPPPSELTDEARSRIEALERHTELGSGFQIATLDMEIRGAGDLLGGEQSGFVASVGFDLFCQMLEEAAHELKGEPVEHEVEPELSVDVDALLPEDYVSEVGVRLSLYKRLASARGDADVEEVAREMEDRFGPPPEDAKRLVELMRLKTELRRLRVLGCEASRKSVTLHLRDDTPLDPQKVGVLVGRKKSPYRLTPDGRLGRKALDDETFKDGIQHADKMLDDLASCLRDSESN